MACPAAAARSSPGHARAPHRTRLYVARRRGRYQAGGATMKQVLLMLLVVLATAGVASAQPTMRTGDAIPRDMREIYDRGVQYLVSKQSPDGQWSGGGEQGPGVTGMALMVLLASGEDPNF